MLPKKEHQQVLDRFHNRLSEVSQLLEEIQNKYGEDSSQYPDEVKDQAFNLSREYYQLIKIWNTIDNFLEFKVDHKLNILKNEPAENWYQELK